MIFYHEKMLSMPTPTNILKIEWKEEDKDFFEGIEKLIQWDETLWYLWSFFIPSYFSKEAFYEKIIAYQKKIEKSKSREETYNVFQKVFINDMKKRHKQFSSEILRWLKSLVWYICGKYSEGRVNIPTKKIVQSVNKEIIEVYKLPKLDILYREFCNESFNELKDKFLEKKPNWYVTSKEELETIFLEAREKYEESNKNSQKEDQLNKDRSYFREMLGL